MLLTKSKPRWHINNYTLKKQNTVITNVSETPKHLIVDNTKQNTGDYYTKTNKKVKYDTFSLYDNMQFCKIPKRRCGACVG